MLTRAIARELEHVESRRLDDEQATVVIVEDDGKVVWRTHCGGVELGCPSMYGCQIVAGGIYLRDVWWGGQWPRAMESGDVMVLGRACRADPSRGEE